jgi:hypothetical protein
MLTKCKSCFHNQNRQTESAKQIELLCIVGIRRLDLMFEFKSLIQNSSLDQIGNQVVRAKNRFSYFLWKLFHSMFEKAN